jgi:hypothetical protein
VVGGFLPAAGFSSGKSGIGIDSSRDGRALVRNLDCLVIARKTHIFWSEPYLPEIQARSFFIIGGAAIKEPHRRAPIGAGDQLLPILPPIAVGRPLWVKNEAAISDDLSVLRSKGLR